MQVQKIVDVARETYRRDGGQIIPAVQLDSLGRKFVFDGDGKLVNTVDAKEK